jgi:hypothetical protein
MGLSETRRNPMNAVFDAVMGLTPEEGAQLDADEIQQHLEEEQANNEEEIHREHCFFDNLLNDPHCLQADDDDDFESNGEEEDDFKIKYEVPYKNATRELVLPATTSFSKFLTALARKMEVSVTHLAAIGYIPSYKPKSSKPLPKLLETTEDYESMMDDIEEFRKNCLKSKSGVVKPFAIVLSDTSAVPERGGAKVSDQ